MHGHRSRRAAGSHRFTPWVRGPREWFLILAISFIVLLAGPLHDARLQVQSPTGQTSLIQWRNPGAGPVDISGQSPRAALQTGGNRHIIVQFSALPNAVRRAQLAEGGVKLLRYLGSNAYFAAVSPGATATLNPTAFGISAAAEIQTQWKMHPNVATGAMPNYAVFPDPRKTVAAQSEEEKTASMIAAVYVLFHPDVSLDTEAVSALARHGGTVRSSMYSINGVVAWVPLTNLSALAGEDAVEWIEPPLPPLSETNDSNRVVTQVDTLQAGPYNLDGTGVNVLVYDGGFASSTHPDFAGRLTVRDTSGLSDHATHVSGTVGGDGTNSSGTYRGMAPGVVIQSYGFEYDGSGQFLYTNPGDIEADYTQAINTYGAEIANNSIGTNVASNFLDCEWEGDYGATSMLIDEIVRGSLGDPMRIIWANGNERGGAGGRCGTLYHTTAPPACAKNHITVGALNSNNDSMTSFSSWGPTDDGRLKPDISAPGCQSTGDFGVTSTIPGGGYSSFCGTSMASPTVTGLSALILEDWKAQFPADPLPPNSMLKVLLAHNAQDLGNTGPDYQFGYGSVRGQDTIDFMRNGSFVEGSLDDSEEDIYVIFVPASTPTLKVTLAWDDPAGAANTVPELVNDLDIVAIEPNGTTTHYPWTLNPASPGDPAVRTVADHANNIEQVLVDNPTSGLWVIKVTGFAVPDGPQPYSLAGTPDLALCSSIGVIVLDRSAYSCSGTLGITVNDCDLDTNSSTIQTVNVTVTSQAEPGGEVVLLTETTPASATFEGSIPLSTTNSAGVLRVANGNTIVATYNDADAGGGGPADVTDTAPVDCVAPGINSVNTSGITSTAAIVNVTTNETSSVEVRYGTSCGALNSSASSAPGTSHAVNLSGLSPGTQYRFDVVATDVADNVTIANNGGSCYSFTTAQQPDYFTEQFATDNDVDNQKLTFTPNGSLSQYDVCRVVATSFPTDPTGGTTLALSDDSFATVNLTGGKQVTLYGQNYGTFYVGSNGYITFSFGSSSFSESLSAHFGQPRISGLYDDLNPAAGGTISRKQLSDRAVVTFQNVPEYSAFGSNSFQIEMFFDGKITLTHLAVSATDGLVGLSAGTGLPGDFQESDLSGYGVCIPVIWVDFAYVGPENGSQAQPYNMLGEAVSAVPAGGIVRIKGDTVDSTTGESPTINKQLTIESSGGTVTIGQN